MRRSTDHRRLLATVILGLSLVHPLVAPAQAAPNLFNIDWSAIIRALRLTFSSWRFVPPARTPTAAPTRTPAATFSPVPTATATRTRTSTHTPTQTPSPTATKTSTPTATRTATPSPTSTPTPRGVVELGLGSSEGIPPAQKLASAVLVFPYVVHEGGTDTRLELVNLSDEDQVVQCFYVRQSDCVEVGFFVSLTPGQPLSWLAGDGANNPLTFTAVPPFDGTGQLTCAVSPRRPDLAAHNAIHGRALVFDARAETVGYGAIGFRRLVPGEFGGVASLDGGLYEACPERLHFQVFARPGGGPTSDLVLVPCEQDLLTQVPSFTVVQLAIVNEFEQVFSSSFSFSCHATISFSSIGTLSRALLGTDTAHLVARGVQVPVMGLVVERFSGFGQTHTTANEPFLEGGRSATLVFP